MNGMRPVKVPRALISVETAIQTFRIASTNDVPILESERVYHWPLGRRPDDHPSLTALNL